MAINYADKFAPKVDERFTNEALSTPAVSQDYEFVGVSTVKYSVNTVALNDYTLSEHHVTEHLKTWKMKYKNAVISRPFIYIRY